MLVIISDFKLRGETDLVVVDNVNPRKDVDEQLGIPRVTSSNTLKVRRNSGVAIQRLASLDLLYHLPHVPLNLP